jgi:hypothetical protein
MPSGSDDQRQLFVALFAIVFGQQGNVDGIESEGRTVHDTLPLDCCCIRKFFWLWLSLQLSPQKHLAEEGFGRETSSLSDGVVNPVVTANQFNSFESCGRVWKQKMTARRPISN